MTATPDERLMTRFLLNDLPEAERESVHDRIAEDAEFFEALCALEDELILKHHQGQLALADHELFERAYSSSSARRRRVESTRAFLDTVHGLKADARRRLTLWQRMRVWLATPRSVPTVALVGAHCC